MRHTPGIRDPRKHEYTEADLLKAGWVCEDKVWRSEPDDVGWSLFENCSFEDAIVHQKAQDIYWKATRIPRRR